MKKILCLMLALVMVFAMVALASCGKDPENTSSAAETSETSEPESKLIGSGTAEDPYRFKGDYTYMDSVTTLATNWNNLTYETSDDAYPADFVRCGLYTFVFNDAGLYPVEGRDPYDSYKLIPEMAAAEPVDVTKEVRAADNNKYGIPEDVDSGYAYKIALNQNACFQDGKAIKAEDYVKSMDILLNPDYRNYRATDYYSGSLSIAGAEARANSGHNKYAENGLMETPLTLADLTLNDDGVYCDAQGREIYVAISATVSDWLGGDSLKYYVENYGDAYFNLEHWEELAAKENADGYAPLTEETYAWHVSVIATEAWGEDETNAPAYWFVCTGKYDEVTFEDVVGCYASGEYEITIVLNKSLKGFYLLYNLTSNWLVDTTLYEANLTPSGETYVSTYCTSVETTNSYGPYKLTSYQTDKQMVFEKNEKWWGWTDGKHVYVDPEDGKYYQMYQTTKVTCDVVAEASARKELFLKGDQITYGLQAEDYEAYGKSEYLYATPSETIFFLILNGCKPAIETREAAEDFDQTTTDLQSMTLLSFRKAMAVTYDKEDFASTVSPARKGGYGIIGENYIYNPDTCARYRDSEQGMQALCDFYSVDTSKYASLKEAVDSITGYDPDAAKKLYQQAYEEALEAGYITDNDGDGKSDQTVLITYALSSDSEFMTKTMNYLNENVDKADAGTGFEGKIKFQKSAELGNAWSTKLKAGEVDTCLAGWSGSALDPFGLTDLYVSPSYQYDAKWFNADATMLTLTIDGKEITMDIHRWSDALNGAVRTDDAGVDHNFGDGQTSVENRLAILAGIEGKILETYDYLPVLQDASKFLLSKKVFYVVEEYNPICGRGGMTYMRYNYDDAEWAEFCKNADNLKY